MMEGNEKVRGHIIKGKVTGTRRLVIYVVSGPFGSNQPIQSFRHQDPLPEIFILLSQRKASNPQR